MAIWERYDQSTILASVGTHTNTEVLHNEEDTDNFQNADLVLVDGIVTIVTNDDNLVGVRFIIAHEALVDADLDENVPSPDSRMVWYSFFAARGPLIFRLKSKKTLFPQHKLWLQVWKAQGTNTTTIRTGEMVLMQLKH